MPPSAASNVTVEVSLEDLFIWHAALREATDEVPHERFVERIGIDWDACDVLGEMIRGQNANASADGNVRFTISSLELNVIRRCLIATLEGLGVEEFHTRAGREFVEGYLALRRLNELTNDLDTGGYPTAEHDARRHADRVRAMAYEPWWMRQQRRHASAPQPAPYRRLSAVAEPIMVQSNPDHLLTWFAAIRDAAEHLHPTVFFTQIGLDWEACDALGGRLLERRGNPDEDGTIQLLLSHAEATAIHRCLVAAIERLGTTADDRGARVTAAIQAALAPLEDQSR